MREDPGAAPVASARGATADTHEQHRPRERRACLDDLAVPGQQLHEAALGPVVQVARACCPRSFQYAPRAMFSPRHSGSRGTRDEQVPDGDARHLGDGVLGIGHVLEHLDRRSRRRTRRRRTAGSRPSSRGTRGSAPGAVSHSACSCGSSRSMPTTRPSMRCGPLVRSARPRRSRRRAATPARPCTNSSSSVPSKPAMSRVTTGFVEPYLS